MSKEKKNIAIDRNLKVLSIEELKAHIDQSLVDSKMGKLIKATDLIFSGFYCGFNTVVPASLIQRLA